MNASERVRAGLSADTCKIRRDSIGAAPTPHLHGATPNLGDVHTNLDEIMAQTNNPAYLTHSPSAAIGCDRVHMWPAAPRRKEPSGPERVTRPCH
ncbi:hypothetical protein EVAR_29295_1 [Eumeta japonica]|uniref:Uncharacterized protein n=1 Tax=Eumeta variegata TaxID=151549 RepID=A0A4C1VVR9_EUMVA|nr:hypothetical protein EVAR_29295_1 [Eumeta japonica]